MKLENIYDVLKKNIQIFSKNTDLKKSKWVIRNE